MNPITVMFENEQVLVINKPAGLIVHSDGRTIEPSVCEWVLQHYPHMQNVGEPWTSPQGEVIPRPGIVHRLDRDTSGVMILAKTAEAHAFLKAQFQARTVKKTYSAVVHGWPKEDFGIIEAEIGRTKTTPPRWSAFKSSKGNKRNAITNWKVLRRGKTPKGEKVSIIEAQPQTGRTHQIRVHMQYIGHSIVCDKLYAKGHECTLGFNRQALHARALMLQVPGHAAPQRFEAPLPADFMHAQSTLQNTEDMA